MLVRIPPRSRRKEVESEGTSFCVVLGEVAPSTRKQLGPVYRVAQEARHNVAAHAAARQVEVALTRGAAGLELTI